MRGILINSNVTVEDGNDGTMFLETIPSTNPACVKADRLGGMKHR
jgi:hypothetical protein